MARGNKTQEVMCSKDYFVLNAPQSWWLLTEKIPAEYSMNKKTSDLNLIILYFTLLDPSLVHIFIPICSQVLSCVTQNSTNLMVTLVFNLEQKAETHNDLTVVGLALLSWSKQGKNTKKGQE